MSKKVQQYGAPRIRPEFAKTQKTVHLWPDHLAAVRKLGKGNVSAGIAVLVAKHLKQNIPTRAA
jgi:hypothetical protein